jgi:hypothetical protein
MPERNWLNANDFIAYPLIDRADRSFIGGGDLPRKGLSDAGFMLGPGSDFVAGTHDVHLYSVHKSSTRLLFDFRSTAPGMALYHWLFEAMNDVEQNTTLTAVASTIALEISDEDRGEGFISVGDLTELRALSVGEHVLTTPLPVEPALLQSLISSMVSSISIANDARRCPEGNCGSSLSSEESESGDEAFPYILNLDGDILFKNGYNMDIDVDADANSITFNARRGYGLGEPCEDVVIDEGGFQRGEECVNCDEFIRSINGVEMGKNVKLLCGPGVSVVRVLGQNKIQVTVEINRACEQ